MIEKGYCLHTAKSEMVTRIVIGIKVYTCTAYRFSQVRSFRCEQFCTGTVPYFLLAVQPCIA